jgi:hypothetical protein
MKKIERTLFWFRDGHEKKSFLNDSFFCLGTLLNRLLNEKYDEKKIKFINIDFSSDETYKLFPTNPMNYIHYYGAGGGHLHYYGVIDFLDFNKLSDIEKKKLIWKKSYEYLQESAKKIKNESLFVASEYAYNQGIILNFNPDYRMVETEIFIHEQSIKASIWVNFRKEGMFSIFTLEKDGQILFEKDIDNTQNGVEFFLEMYKEIEFKNNIITIKGRKDVDNLPLKITLLPENIEKIERVIKSNINH